MNQEEAMGGITAIAECAGGRAKMVLRSEHQHPVTLRHFIIVPPQAGTAAENATAALAALSVVIPPGDVRVVDVTEHLRRFTPGRRVLQIALGLDPKPAGQPPPATYVVCMEGGECVEFRAAGDEPAR
jgi:hypothetical protein